MKASPLLQEFINNNSSVNDDSSAEVVDSSPSKLLKTPTAGALNSFKLHHHQPTTSSLSTDSVSHLSSFRSTASNQSHHEEINSTHHIVDNNLQLITASSSTDVVDVVNNNNNILDEITNLQNTLHEQHLFYQQIGADIGSTCDRINGWRMNLPLIINHIRLQLYSIDRTYSLMVLQDLGLQSPMWSYPTTSSSAFGFSSPLTFQHSLNGHDLMITLYNMMMEEQASAGNSSTTNNTGSGTSSTPSLSASSLVKTTGKYSKLFQSLWSNESTSPVNSNPSLLQGLDSGGINNLFKFSSSIPKPSRLYKFQDKDHPLSVLKHQYEELIEHIRLNPKFFSKVIKYWISKQTLSQLYVAKDFEAHERMAFIINYSFYGNLSNPLESKCLLKFIKYTLENVLDDCSNDNPFEIFDNVFLFRLIFLYVRRKGKEFVKNVLGETMIELFSNEDLELPIVSYDIPSNEQKAEQPKSKSSFLFFQASCASNNGDTSPISPNYISTNVFTSSKSMVETNLYNLCTRILFSLYDSFLNLSPNILLLMKYLLKGLSKKYGSKLNNLSKGLLLKRFFFGWYLLPAASRPECFGLTSVPALGTTQSKIRTIVLVLQAIALERPFEKSSSLSYLNDFIFIHSAKINEMFEKLVREWFSEKNDLIEGLKRYANTVAKKDSTISFSIEEMKKNQVLSPTCLSTKDIELILHVCMDSEFLKKSDSPIAETIHDIKSWNRTKFKDEKFIVLNYKDLKKREILESLEISENLSSTPRSSFEAIVRQFKQVLLMVNSIERICSEMKSINSDSTTKLLQLLSFIDVRERNEKTWENGVSSVYIQEFSQSLKNTPFSIESIINRIYGELRASDSNLDIMIDKQKQLLRILQSIELQVNDLESERAYIDDMFDDLLVGELISTIDFKQFCKEFSKSPFIEDQLNIIKNQYNIRKVELLNSLKDLKLSEHQVQRIDKILQKTIISKVVRYIVPKGYEHNTNMNRNSFYKEENLLRVKMTSLFDVHPEDFGIPKVYFKICNSKLVQEELKKLDVIATTPQEKVQVILNSCMIIVELMKSTGSSYNIDDFLILLVYNIIKTGIPNLYSNLIFIKRFYGAFLDPPQSKQPLYGIGSENEYWFKQFETAVMFLLDYSNNSNVQPLLTKEETKKKQEPVKEEVLSPKRVTNSVRLTESDTTITTAKNFGRFENIACSELKFSDIPDLLNEYKLLLGYFNKQSNK